MIIFLVPGFMTIELDRFLCKREKINNFEIEKIVNYLILSVVSTIIVFIMIYVFDIDNIKTLSELGRKMNILSFILKYFLLMLLSIPISEVIYIIYRKLIILLKNKTVNKKRGEIDIEGDVIWNRLCKNNKDILEYRIEIIKNGELITNGYIAGESSQNYKISELKILPYNNIKLYLNKEIEDEELSEEYYDLEKDILLKLYKNFGFKKYSEILEWELHKVKEIENEIDSFQKECIKDNAKKEEFYKEINEKLQIIQKEKEERVNK